MSPFAVKTGTLHVGCVGVDLLGQASRREPVIRNIHLVMAAALRTGIGPPRHSAADFAGEEMSQSASPIDPGGSRLKPEEYLRRVESAQTAIQKSLLALLALFAFWLAIENSYARYVILLEQSLGRDTAGGGRSRPLEALRGALLKIESEKLAAPGKAAASAASEASAAPAAAASAASAAPAAAEAQISGRAFVAAIDTSQAAIQAFCDEWRSATDPASRTIRANCKLLADQLASHEKHKERAEKLQDEALDLSIVGTKIPSRLALAAEVWLVVLFGWLHYFAAKRFAAHRNLALLSQALSGNEWVPGKVPAAGLWLGPLPRLVRIHSHEGSVVSVPASRLRFLFGWTAQAERRQHWALALIMAVLFAAVIRMTYIALDMTTAEAARAKFVTGTWQFPLTVVALALMLMCTFRMVKLLRPAPVDFDGSDLPVPSRRGLMLDFGALVAAVVASRHLRPDEWKATTSLAVDRKSTTKRTGNPRFISAAARARRRANRQTVLVANEQTLARKMVVSEWKPPKPADDSASSGSRRRLKPKVRTMATIHAMDAKSKLRLRSAPPKSWTPTWAALSIDQIDQRLKATLPGRQRRSRSAPAGTAGAVPALNRLYTWPFEVQALGLIEDGRFDEGCKFLLRGVLLTLRNESGDAVNLRLLDLLAGMAVRLGKEAEYLDPMVAAVRQHLSSFDIVAVKGVRPMLKRSRPRRHCADSKQGNSSKTARQRQELGVPMSIAGLRERVNKWALSKGKDETLKWRKKWRQNEVVVWHHPIDTEPPKEPPQGCKKVSGVGQRAVQIPKPAKT